MSVFEIGMLVSFGLGWPISIIKSWRSRQTGGKSIGFLFVVLLGYISGTLHKLFYNLDFVIILYIINGVMVAIDIALFFRNRRLERKAQA